MRKGLHRMKIDRISLAHMCIRTEDLIVERGVLSLVHRRSPGNREALFAGASIRPITVIFCLPRHVLSNCWNDLPFLAALDNKTSEKMHVNKRARALSPRLAFRQRELVFDIIYDKSVSRHAMLFRAIFIGILATSEPNSRAP